MNGTRRPARAFSLIELLVSISIISLLLSILLPAMSGSRKTAKRTQCLARLRQLYVVHAEYVNSDGRFPELNNMEDDGTWQYNYLIFDGMDFNNNFGPLVRVGLGFDDLTFLYCPVQTDSFHSMGTANNPWPAIPGFDTRSGYGRRYHVSGKSLSQMRTKALLADVIHLPSVVATAHKTGVNVAYTDGHAKWVQDPGILTDNELIHPFSVTDNPLVKDIWKKLDEAI
ncbi:MAG: prepilin-type N-terminal cleavage/methylation domain-containing protein [Phycisphaerae bacterium]